MASERELRGKKTARNASETVHINDSNVPTSDSNAKECVINDDVSEEKDLVRCFCGNDQDFGEMACCDLCSGWFHFRCMRFKEGVDLLAKKDFVCCFCLASKTLSLLREVESLKKEVKELRESSAKEEGEMPTCTIDGKPGSSLGGQITVKGKPSYSAVVMGPGEKKHPVPHKKENPRKPKSLVRGTAKGKKVVPKKAQAERKSVPGSTVKAQQFVGRRKLWGTKREDTEEDVKAVLVSRVPEAASIEVKRVFKSEKGRFRWWFWVLGEGSVLKLVDGGSYGDFWKIEKEAPFLESVVVRVLGR